MAHIYTLPHGTKLGGSGLLNGETSPGSPQPLSDWCSTSRSGPGWVPITMWIDDTSPILPSVPIKCIIPKCKAYLCLCYSIFLEMLSPSILPVFKVHFKHCYLLWSFLWPPHWMLLPWFWSSVTFCSSFLLWPVSDSSLDQSLVSLISSHIWGTCIMDVYPPLLKAFWR